MKGLSFTHEKLSSPGSHQAAYGAVFVQCTQRLRWLRARCPHAARELPVSCPHAAHMLPTHCSCAAHTLPALCPHAAHTLPTQCPCAAHVLPTCCAHAAHELPALCTPTDPSILPPAVQQLVLQVSLIPFSLLFSFFLLQLSEIWHFTKCPVGDLPTEPRARGAGQLRHCRARHNKVWVLFSLRPLLGDKDFCALLCKEIHVNITGCLAELIKTNKQTKPNNFSPAKQS